MLLSAFSWLTVFAKRRARPNPPAGFAILAPASLVPFLYAFAVPAAAQPPSAQPPPRLTFQYERNRDTAADSASGPALSVRVEIAPGWHINADAPLDEFLVPTRLDASAEGVRFGKPHFPPPERIHSDAVGGDMLLFSGAFEIKVPLLGKSPRAARDAKSPPRTRVTLHYQACDQATCFPPKEVTLER
jgi:hypothetical protein